MENEKAVAEKSERLVADLIVEQLVEWGVQQVYGILGSNSSQIISRTGISDSAWSVRRRGHWFAASLKDIPIEEHFDAVGNQKPDERVYPHD
jgi:hypothetical protein